jgi:eukaryotic-like serine/threonine-protein kinase
MINHPTEIDKYLILEHLGSGHFGNVYLAQDRALNTYKAIKVLDIENPRQFIMQLEEAQLLHKCQHKHIVRVNEAGIYQVGDMPKVVIDMEYIPGGSLGQYMRGHFLTVIEATQYIRDILFGLEHAHNQGVLHRDIKPANIMLSDGSAKLSDFGLATSAGKELIGSPKGYIRHCAPEMFVNGVIKGETTVLTDIYAVGITYFRLVSGLVNWPLDMSNPNAREIFQTGKFVEHVGFPPYVPNKVRRIINKATNPNPQHRFQSALEMRQAIVKLRPHIDWKLSGNAWEAKAVKGDLFAIELSEKDHVVIVRKNGRRIRNDCRKFSANQFAAEYISQYVANSTYE